MNDSDILFIFRAFKIKDLNINKSFSYDAYG
jgi:hypothetical protein